MKYLRFLVPFLLSIILGWALNRSWISSTKPPIPPIGKLLSPFQGFWQNAKNGYEKPGPLTYVEGLKGPVSVYTDDQRVPHITASNNEDLYFMQGYITARDRLWQMEFFSYAAAGRVSELIGEKGLDYDRTQRRLGLPYAAEQSVKLMIASHPLSKMVMESYAAGVNAYIKNLSEKDYPVEYKIMNYKPETWTPVKTAILLKFMASMLTARDFDFEMTNALNLFGRATFDRLYPDYEGGDPIIPVGTPFNFTAVKIDTPNYIIPPGLLTYSPFEKPASPNIGSNNWAVSGKKTASGSPILCSDPHLGLNLPSIWYEMQLTSPDVNVYGVTIPGSPCVTIGFNEHIAWGETNAERDVKDWYKVQFTDAGKDHYLFDGKPRETQKHVEEIKIRNGNTYYDTVIYTHIGPVTYDDKFKHYENPYPVALRWTALDTSDELRTFYYLNRAKNHADYMDALNYYTCPAQNFVFACTDGDIAIRQQGHFVAKWKEQGKFIQDGTSSAQQWQAFIPNEQNPQILNPERGFVSSANQHPTDSTYPYYYNGWFEYYRNQRINEVLTAINHIAPQDMMHLQNDNMNIMAKDIVPYMVDVLSKSTLNDEESKALEELRKWNYFDDTDKVAPAIFQATWDTLYSLVWDEFATKGNIVLQRPNQYTTVKLLKESPNDTFMDIRSTPQRESAPDLIKMAFSAAVNEIKEWKSNHTAPKLTWEKYKATKVSLWIKMTIDTWLSNQKTTPLTWGRYKGTKIAHWAKIAAFDVDNVVCGGYRHIVNATDGDHGPSWRMIVSMEKGKVKGWGIYPGGQSGNPGSPYYADRIPEWATGKYHELQFLKREERPTGNFISETYQTPK